MSKVLVVDDERDVSRVVALRLEAAGFETVVANDARRAFARVERDRPDLVLLDISMPGGTGFDLVEKIKGVRRRKPLPVVFMTASKLHGLRERAAELGAVAFIEKPYQPQELIAAISEALTPCPV